MSFQHLGSTQQMRKAYLWPRLICCYRSSETSHTAAFLLLNLKFAFGNYNSPVGRKKATEQFFLNFEPC